jgi:lipid-A-disaccharide synthase-like uncharacterized protein
MQQLQTEQQKWLEIALIIVVVIALGALFAWMFGQLPTERAGIAYDWTFRIYEALEGGKLQYQPIVGPHHPPWSMLPLIPLGLLSPSASWGVLVYAYLLVLTISVPYKRPIWRSVLALILMLVSSVAVRAMLDGNLEILSLTGSLVLILGYNTRRPLVVAIGVLLASAKPQVGTSLIVVVGIYMLLTWPRAAWLKAAAVVLPIVVVTFLWRGRDWLEVGLATGHSGWVGSSILTHSLPPILAWALIGAVGVITLFILAKSDYTLSREKAGMIIAANLFIAPFGSVNSLLPVLAVGIIPLFIRRPWLGLPVIALLIFPNVLRLGWALSNQAIPADVPDEFWNIPVFVAWAILAWQVYIEDRQSDRTEVAQPLVADAVEG